MPSQTQYLKDVGPWFPVYDARRLIKTSIIDGRNWVFGNDGPKSAFGHSFSNYVYTPFASAKKVTELEIDDEIFYGTPEGVFRVNSVTGQYEPILTVNTSREYWPWTTAECGNKHFFAQYNVGLWQYDPDTNTVTEVDTIGQSIRWICLSYGHLIALSDTVVMQSALDDGTDFSPSLATGAGAQALSVLDGVKPEDVFRVDPVVDGFVVSTAKGLLKGEAVSAVYVFRYYALSRAVRIFSPNGAVVIPDLGLITLDKSGMHTTNGAIPTVWEPEMGNFFKDKLINALDHLKKDGTVGMYFSIEMQALFVSFSDAEAEGYMNRTYVWNASSQKWSSFNYIHHGLFQYLVGTEKADTCSFMGEDGYMHSFTNLTYSEVEPPSQNVLSDFIYRPTAEPVTLINVATDGSIVYLGSSELNQMDQSPTPFIDILTPSEVTLIDGVPTVNYLPHIGLNSIVDIGMFRFAEQQHADETSMVTNVIVGINSTDGTVSSEDLGAESGSEDLGSEDGSEDLGENSSIADDFSLLMLSTDDGFTIPLQGWEEMVLVNANGSSNQYSGAGFSAIYHRFKISASDPGQAFNVKLLDVQGSTTGRRL